MKRMRRGRFLLPVIAAMLLLSACGTGTTTQPGQGTETPSGGTSNPGQTTTTAPAPTQQKQKVLVYYSDDNLTKMEKEEKEITFEKDGEKYQKAMELLGKPTKKGNQPLWPNFAFHSITLNKGQLTIDADSKNQYNMGSTGEMMAIEALRMTMFQFPEVQSIQIIQDGKPVETLMGHVEVSEPITR